MFNEQVIFLCLSRGPCSFSSQRKSPQTKVTSVATGPDPDGVDRGGNHPNRFRFADGLTIYPLHSLTGGFRFLSGIGVIILFTQVLPMLGYYPGEDANYHWVCQSPSFPPTASRTRLNCSRIFSLSAINLSSRRELNKMA
jgi:hypothetical protein